MKSNFDHQLRLFIEIANCKSLSAAAEMLTITQSGLSRQLASLEEFIGQPLFVRHGRGVQLTEAGQKLFDAASSAYQLVDNTILLGCGFFELARFKPCRGLRTHHAEDSVTLSSNMQKNFRKGPGSGGRAPGELVARECLGEIDLFCQREGNTGKPCYSRVAAGLGVVEDPLARQKTMCTRTGRPPERLREQTGPGK